MIKAEKLTKCFGTQKALSAIDCEIPEGSVFGLVGSNGAGKSTFLRLLAGVYKPTGGSLTVNGQEVYGNTEVLSKLMFVPDDLYFLPGANIRRMAELYRSARGSISDERLASLAKLLDLDMKKPIAQFSKGMKRQAATILALACEPDVILFDETFDGLDPVMRSVIKRVIVDDVMERRATVIVTSHSLRELEDTCDQLALLHKGGLVLRSEVADLKTERFKLQIALNRDFTAGEIAKASGCEVRTFVKSGSVANCILSGDREQAAAGLAALEPAILDILPLSLEEVFVYEMDALGYKFDDLTGGEQNEEK